MDLPSEGGRYVRDPKTGVLSAAPAEDDAASPAPIAPVEPPAEPETITTVDDATATPRNR